MAAPPAAAPRATLRPTRDWAGSSGRSSVPWSLPAVDERDLPPLPADYARPAEHRDEPGTDPDAGPHGDDRRRPRWPWAAAAVVLAAAAGTVYVLHRGNDAKPARHEIVYRVSGKGAADISYYDDASGAYSTLTNQKLPWTGRTTVTGNYSDYAVTATFHSTRATGPLSCSITRDGRLVSARSGSGREFVGCDGRTPSTVGS